eukprot:TRINITY_DN2957_c2_g1_i1.p1 TRINITY_DN2957_c2_g1~~TRINITY_DN2957_c2_g1_i1.p1  ORF type:complete len:154 (+),score=32.19 TRINITY_DN2957_c2_g1_i1:180-641(+)
MRWLAEEPNPMPLPLAPRVASRELLTLLQECMLTTDPDKRLTAAELLAQPFLRHVASLESVRTAPPPTLHVIKPPAQLPKPPTAWQLYQEAHKEELAIQGFRGGKLVRELHRRWKELQAEGGKELQELLQREAALSKSSVSVDSEGREGSTAA